MNRSIASRLGAPALCTLALSLAACGGDSGPAEPVVVEVSGAKAADLQATVDAFRSRLGANLGSDAPAVGTGRREINWDGVPLDRLDPFPGDFFNTTSPRGAVFSTPGSRLKVSGDAGTPSFEFADVTAKLPNGQPWGPIEFGTFSAQRMFATMDSPITDIRFFVPGTTRPAAVTSFGVVLADVDLANVTALEFYGSDGQLKFRRFVAPAGAKSEGLTFVGVTLPWALRAARVRIIAGSHPVNAPFQDPPPDGVGVDDVIYSEPAPL